MHGTVVSRITGQRHCCMLRCLTPSLGFKRLWSLQLRLSGNMDRPLPCHRFRTTDNKASDLAVHGSAAPSAHGQGADAGKRRSRLVHVSGSDTSNQPLTQPNTALTMIERHIPSERPSILTDPAEIPYTTKWAMSQGTQRRRMNRGLSTM